jgi:hypothetical protein
VLILVIALLVLLALIGTAYLSSTQTERFTSHQNAINTEADLLMQGMINAVESQIASGVFGSTSTGSQYRPAYQEMPQLDASGNAVPYTLPNGAYYNYDSVGTAPPAGAQYLATDPDPCDIWLADRLPTLVTPTSPISNVNPAIWNSVSWPLFKDSSGEYTFDSPLVGPARPTETALHLGVGTRKGTIQFVLGSYQLADGSVVPAMTVNGGGYSNPDGSSLATTSILAGSAAGDGVADSLFCKVPVGPINGITYYVATRIVDSNSAINASSAWDATTDTAFASGDIGPNAGTAPTYGTGANAKTNGNFGMFRSNVGLSSLLDTNSSLISMTAPSYASEINALNQYRLGGLTQNAQYVSPVAGPVMTSVPLTTVSTDPTLSQNAPTNFRWFSYGNVLDSQLTARSGNPGWAASNVSTTNRARMQWLGVQESAALAYKFTLYNPLVPTSPLEMFFPNELVSVAHSTPYAASQYQQWYNDNFYNYTFFQGSNSSISSTRLASSLRPVLTGDNPVSNAIPSRLGNTTTPITWTAPTTSTPVTYNFGDWVTDGGKSFVCIQSHVATTANTYEPGLTTGGVVGVNSAAVPYWAGVVSAPYVTGAPLPGLPWTNHPVKANINTATFGELWLAFAQVMTDTIGVDPQYGTGSAQWLPPQQPNLIGNAAGQMPQFRNVWRTSAAPGATALSMSQMLKIRAAIAAINAIDLRGGANDNTAVISSRRITLTNPGATSPTPQYNVEVFGMRPQPFISEMVVQIEKPGAGGGGNSGTAPNGGGGTANGVPAATIPTPSNSYIAIELVNPYPVSISMHNWQLCSVDRTQAATGMTLLPLNQSTGGASLLDSLTLPPAAPNAAGIMIPSVSVIASATTPPQTPQPSSVPNSPQPIPTVPLLGGTGISQLVNAIGKELVIVRPRRADGQLSTSNDPADPFGTEDPTTSSGCAAMVPVDQLDLTGADSISGAAAFATTDYPIRLQYRRGSTPSSTLGSSYAWHFVYPGIYDLSKSTPPDFTQPNPFRMQGIVLEKSNQITSGDLGFTDAGPAVKTAPTTVATTFDTAPIQLANLFTAGPNSLNYADSTKMNAHPFGQFARNGDMLQVPFIGSYCITAATALAGSATIVEMNSVTMDSALAYDTILNPYPSTTLNPAAAVSASKAAPGNVYLEQIGRFCPVGNPQGGSDSDKLDFGSTPSLYHYHWGEKIFNYLTVQSPQNDFYPNVDPSLANNAITPEATPARYPGNTGTAPTVPVGVANYDSTITNANTAGKSEDTVGVQGQININTAPAVVLAQLPFYAAALNGAVPYSASAQLSNNATLAQAIVTDRAANGPFKSIFDLYRVPAFRAASDGMSGSTPTGPSPVNGVFSPGGLPNNVPTPIYNTSSVRYDFNERFLLLNNISNLITTRSDTFTCYILLQGWRNVGTSNPTLAVQRRSAFIVDRNTVTPSNLTPMTFKFPSD